MDDETIGLAARRVDRHNYQKVYNELQNKCRNPGEDISKKWPGAAPTLSKRVCGSIDKCHGIWVREFANAPGFCSVEAATHGVCSMGGYS